MIGEPGTRDLDPEASDQKAGTRSQEQGAAAAGESPYSPLTVRSFRLSMAPRSPAFVFMLLRTASRTETQRFADLNSSFPSRFHMSKLLPKRV